MRSPSNKRVSISSSSDNSPSFTDFEKLQSSFLRDAPSHITESLVTTRGQDSLDYSQRERDRRLRQLIRRYENQIRYGCYNRNCNAPTCLSFRTRNSKVPLRPFNDLSARSLACHLVEESAKNGKDATLGLCPNQPKVPWYQDERRVKARTSPRGEIQEQNILPEQEVKLEGEITKSRSSRRSSSMKDPRRISFSAPDKLRHPKVQPAPEADRVPDGPDSSPPTQPALVDGVDAQSSNSCQEVDRSNEVQPPQVKSKNKKDLSSFVQSIWDTSAVRGLSKAPEGTVVTSSQGMVSRASTNGSHSDHAPAKPESSASVQPVTPQSVLPGLCLGLLTYRNIIWLGDREMTLDEESEMYFYHFIKQSIRYVFSDPLRLVKSAGSWTEAYSDSKGEHETDVTELSKADAVDHSSKKSTQVIHLDRTFSALRSIGVLERGTDLMYSSLYSALQKCYRSSSPLKQAKHNREMKLQSLKLAGGGFWDTSASSGMSSERGVPTNSQIVQIFVLVFLAAVLPLVEARSIPSSSDITIIFATLADIRNDGYASFNAPYGSESDPDKVLLADEFLRISDHFDEWYLARLGHRLADCISHHMAVAEIARHQSHTKTPKHLLDIAFERLIAGVNQYAEQQPRPHVGTQKRAIIGFSIMELARSVLLKEWDRDPIIERTSPVGGALEILSTLFRHRDSFVIGTTTFYMPFIWRGFEEMEMPVQWLDFKPTGKQMHILSYSFLFDVEVLVKYWRTINIAAMRRRHEEAVVTFNLVKSFLSPAFSPMHWEIPVYGGKDLLKEMRPLMGKFFVMTVRRSHVLEDAINQIWRRQRREILRPLRVRLGKDEGEDGLDHGGVQQEFFRLVFAEAFNDDCGMFTVDEKTRMTWFRPGSLEPLHKFEALGILMSLAIYNSVTLPITMPLAFYRKLMGLKNKKLEHIEDGWPDLVQGLKSLLDFEGDVEETIGRSYEFSYEFAGKTTNVDMSKDHPPRTFPSSYRSTSMKGKEKVKSTSFDLKPLSIPSVSDITPPSDSPERLPLSPTAFEKSSRTSSFKDTGISTPVSLDLETSEDTPTDSQPVTNSNRVQYVKDYIVHLTSHSIEKQYSAFARGFFTCIDERALRLFTSDPKLLREVVEGAQSQQLSLKEMKETAKYEYWEDEETKKGGYTTWFWEVLEELDNDETAGNNLKGKVGLKLLEFVTASSRIPVGGLQKVAFIVQKNGDVYENDSDDDDDDFEDDADGDDAPTRSVDPQPATEPAPPPAVDGPIPTSNVDAAAATGEAGPAPRQRQRTIDKEADARLPTSATCYGRLLLPRYSTREVLKERMAKALEWSVGFGTL